MTLPYDTHQFLNFVGRSRDQLRTIGLQIESGSKFHEWRCTPDEYIAPFAFRTVLCGEGLTEERRRDLRSVNLFAREEQYQRNNGTLFSQRELVVYDMTPQPKPTVMLHATPSERVNDILREGLRPSRLTQKSTTNFPDAERWIHLTANVADALKWLNNPKNRKHLPAGEYTLLRVSTQDISDLFADPYSDFGFVTEADKIARDLEELETVVVGPICENESAVTSGAGATPI
jgi:hypothetical protein